ncbi:hypothetical protein [Pseudomonas sp. LRF_L74]|uniref:hypothetical protein n=1 Tax=Pseudomonas sp. LRF_L74 TaxID=3369422 RepID=UPI003F643A79
MSQAHTLADLVFARNTQSSLVEYLKSEARHDDPLVIAAIGDLQVRIDAADALLQRVARAPGAPVEARLASAEAARLASELHTELTGRQAARPLVEEQEAPLFSQRRALGDHYLNGEAI